MPLLEQFHKWTLSSGHPVTVYAVDVWERMPTDDQKIKKVGDYWKSKAFTMPTLLDLDGSGVQPYGFTSIPTTVIVDADGRVAAVHSGYRPDMVNLLKQEVTKLLAEG